MCWTRHLPGQKCTRLQLRWKALIVYNFIRILSLKILLILRKFSVLFLDNKKQRKKAVSKVEAEF